VSIIKFIHVSLLTSIIERITFGEEDCLHILELFEFVEEKDQLVRKWMNKLSNYLSNNKRYLRSQILRYIL